MDRWEQKLACAVACKRCQRPMSADQQRILSVYDHEAICIACKHEEERRPDYEKVSREAIGTCMADTELMYSDPKGYCLHHFYPFTCK